MSITVGSARVDERGKYSGGTAGDQTGKEVMEQAFYLHNKGWYCIRPKSVGVSVALANAMHEACHNDNIGYDQGQRTGVITKLKQYGRLSFIKEKTECDCSALVRACVIQATGTDPGNFTTSNEASVLAKTGLFETKFSITSASQLYDGDILVTKTKGHTVIVTSGNPRSANNVFKACDPGCTSIVVGLKSVGCTDTSLAYRKKIAAKNGISGYIGTAKQNTNMLSLLKAGKLLKP